MDGDGVFCKPIQLDFGNTHPTLRFHRVFPGDNVLHRADLSRNLIHQWTEFIWIILVQTENIFFNLLRFLWTS